MVSYLPTAFNFGRGTLTYIGPDKPSQPVTVGVKFLDHKGKEVGYSEGQVSADRLTKSLSGGGSRDTVIKNPVPLIDIVKWSLIVNWDGKEEVIDLDI